MAQAAAMIGGILFPANNEKQLRALNSPDFEELRIFTRLRSVGVETREDGNYDVVIGRLGRIENVPKEELDAFDTSDIIKS